MTKLDHGQLRSTSWSEAVYEIEGLLTELVEAVDAYMIINVDRVDDVFVQFHCSTTGLIAAEAAATYRCAPDCLPRHVLEPSAAGQMKALGWQPPDLDPLRLAAPGTGHPNFYRAWSVDAGWPPALFSDLTMRTMHDVWHLLPANCIVRGGLLGPGQPPGCT